MEFAKIREDVGKPSRGFVGAHMRACQACHVNGITVTQVCRAVGEGKQAQALCLHVAMFDLDP